MSRARKWLLRLGLAVGALLLVLMLLCVWLLHTQSGLRFALNHGVAAMHGQLSYARASGSLAGTASIEGLRYHNDDGTHLALQRVTLALQPWALLGKRLHLRTLHVDGIALDLAPSKQPSQSSGEFSLRPPINLTLDDVLLQHIDVRASGKPVFAADSLALAGIWNGRKLAIRKLALRAPAGHADLDGSVAVAAGHAGKGTATFDWTQDGTRYAGTLVAQSDGKAASLRANLTAPLALTADATLVLNPQHAWTLALRAPRFDARALPQLPTSLHTLALDLQGAGDANGGSLRGDLDANGITLQLDPAKFRYDGQTLALDPLRLRSAQIPGSASATGKVQLAANPVAFALDAQWDDVQLPASLAGQALSTHGTLHLGGNAQAYTVQGALALGPPDHLANLKVDLAGTPRGIDLHALQLLQANGGLDLHGSVDFAPRVTWKLDATARQFDPGAFAAGWNGALDFTLASTGTLTPQGPQATLKLDGVAGSLRQRNVAGSRADLAITPGNLLQGTLRLVAGNSSIAATGKPGARTDATATLAIASLGDWLPGATGRLAAHFTVKGAWPKLAVAGQAQGEHLRLGNRGIDTLALDANLPDLSQAGGKLDLALTGVHANGMAFTQLHLQGQGSAAAHTLQLDARGTPLGATLALRGSWNAKAQRWSGSLDGVALAPQGTPAWRQTQASTLTWADGALALSSFCLDADAARACVSARRSGPGTTTATFSLHGLPLQWLAGWAPGADPLEARGALSGTGQTVIGARGALSARVHLDAGAGSLAYASHPQRSLLAWNTLAASVETDAANQRVHLDAALADGGGHLKGDVAISGATQALAGTFDADLRDLGFLEALSPEIANVHGALAGNLQLSGTLAAPRFQGDIKTRDFAAELPRAGLKLHDGQVALAGDANGALAIHGTLASGKGVLHVDGSVGLAADAPLQLAIKGDDVLLADIPAAHVVASPNLHVARSHGVFAITGSVTLPNAKVEAEKLPGQGPSSASPDVVIVDAPPPAPVAPLAVQADITVKLGDAVQLQGYGLDGRLGGQLAVHVQPGQTATGRGQISVTGKYQAYGQDLTIEHGRLLFAGTRLDNPGLDIRAVRTLRSQDITVGLAVRGTALHPSLTVFSEPAMEQAEALSYLVTGRSLDTLKSGEGDTLNTAAQALGGLAGDKLAKSIGSRLGLEAGVSSSEALGGTAFTAGKYLSPRLYLSYGVGLFSPGQVITLRYTLNRFLQFEAENATTGNRASLNYRIEK